MFILIASLHMLFLELFTMKESDFYIEEQGKHQREWFLEIF